MTATIRKALEYALTISGDPPKIKKYMEDYLSSAGCDRRYKIKWRASTTNLKYEGAGIFEYAGKRYYFNKIRDKIELERI